MVIIRRQKVLWVVNQLLSLGAGLSGSSIVIYYQVVNLRCRCVCVLLLCAVKVVPLLSGSIVTIVMYWQCCSGFGAIACKLID